MILFQLSILCHLSVLQFENLSCMACLITEEVWQIELGPQLLITYLSKWSSLRCMLLIVMLCNWSNVLWSVTFRFNICKSIMWLVEIFSRINAKSCCCQYREKGQFRLSDRDWLVSENVVQVNLLVVFTSTYIPCYIRVVRYKFVRHLGTMTFSDVTMI